MRCALLAILLLSPLAATAAEPLSAEAFEARTTGRTLTYGVGGTVYGVEQYLPGRRVIWAFVKDQCREGVWYEEAPGRICFTYDHDGAPQCWNFYDEPGGLRARFLGGMGQDLVEVDQSVEGLSCPGPDVGA